MSFGLQSCGITVLRGVVGIVFAAHGYQKLFRFGIHGVSGMLGHLGIPLAGFFAVVVTLVEFGGGILLILGVATRVAAAFLAIDMIVALLVVHLKNGFFNPHGVEFPLTLLAASICLMLAGGGALTLKRG
jgi:putative oxidoreductase